jgi:hypothetical protein
MWLAGCALWTGLWAAPVVETPASRVAVFYASPEARAAALPSVALLGSRRGPEGDGGVTLRPEFATADGRQVVTLQVPAGTSLYGTGEVSGPLLRNGRTVTLWNSDVYGYDAKTPALYQSHPWVLGVRADGTAFGRILDNGQFGILAASLSAHGNKQHFYAKGSIPRFDFNKYSYDAKNWTDSSAPAGSAGMYNQVSAHNGEIMIARTDLNQLVYSPDGTNWSNVGPSGHWFGICRDDAGKYFGNYAIGSTYYIAYGDAANGFSSSTWTNGVPLGVKFYDGTYFVCTYDQGVWASNDRTTWTQLINTTKIVVDLERFNNKLYLSCISDNVQVWDGATLSATGSASAQWRGITQANLKLNLVIPSGGAWESALSLRQNSAGAWSNTSALYVVKDGAWIRA